MPIIWNTDVGNFVNACAACGDWPVTTVNDRCRTCHDLHLVPADPVEDLYAVYDA